MNGNTSLIVFNPTEVEAFGNTFLNTIVAHELVKEEAEAQLQAANERESFIDFELTRAVMFLHSKGKLSAHDIFGDKKDSEKLYRQLLIDLGVLKRTITDDDKVVYDFTDPALRGQFYFGQDEQDRLYKEYRRAGVEEEVAKARAEAEIKRRRSRRNLLNWRLARAFKATVALVDSGATLADLTYVEGPNGQLQPQIRKGPAEIMGTKAEPVLIYTKAAAKAEGATQMPTLGGLVKVAEAKAKPSESASAGRTDDTRPTTDGPVDEKDFLASVNTVTMVVKGREGQFSEPEKTALKNLLTLLKECGIK